ncbi:MAG TPA: GIY-YIG nuclease family protein [Bacillales bacterium]|nr:GIY-YIG nuclease family protein [Bacillales bacterium]
MRHYVYTLKCKDGTYYTGYTNDLERRMKAHEDGKAAKYTRGRGPFDLVRLCEYETKSEAMRAEYGFKQLTRKEKELFIKNEGENAGGNGDAGTAKLS